MRQFKVRWNWYMQFHRLNSHFNRFFSYFHYPGASWGFLSCLCISWSFHGCRICCLRQLWKYYENTNSEKTRTLQAGYTFISFAPLYFQTVTSCPLRGLFSIVWDTKQLSCFPFKFTLFNNHNNHKNNRLSFTKIFSKLCNPTYWNYNPRFKLHAV